MKVQTNPEKIIAAIACYAVPGGLCILGMRGLTHLDNVSPFKNLPVFLMYMAIIVLVFGGLGLILWLYAYHIDRLKDWFSSQDRFEKRKPKMYFYLIVATCTFPILGFFISLIVLLNTDMVS